MYGTTAGCREIASNETLLAALINNQDYQIVNLRELIYRLDAIANRLDSNNFPKNHEKPIDGQSPKVAQPETILSKFDQQHRDRNGILEELSVTIGFLERIA